MIKVKREVIFFVLIVVIILMSYLTWASLSLPKTECLQVKYVESYIDVKSAGGRSFIGLNTDKDALKFGGISSGGTALRSINVRNSEKSEVSVSMEGELAGWTEITPNEFELEKDQSQQVF